MGLLIDGIWHDKWYDTDSSGGRFERSASQYRHWITPDGSAGPTGEAGFKAESGRYHLYVSYACPWAHRTLVMRALKGLEAHIGVSVVHPLMAENGWTFDTDFKGATGDPLYALDNLYELYLKAAPNGSGRVTVPVLWDRERETIVNNESADITRMLSSAFDHIGARGGDYDPDDLHEAITSVNEVVYDEVNNGVYKAGFATTQDAYDDAVQALFRRLDWLESRLDTQRYLVGNTLTEADVRLWTTLVRFDAVYATHFKCDRRRIADYPNLLGLLRDVYQLPGVTDTVHLDHIRHHYFRSHPTVNPHGIISIGPIPTFDAAHDRDRLGPRRIHGT